jgi:hypothetical protein
MTELNKLKKKKKERLENIAGNSSENIIYQMQKHKLRDHIVINSYEKILYPRMLDQL